MANHIHAPAETHLLAARLADLLHRERFALADFLLALAEFDRRRLWLELGHSSLFYFLHRGLGLSKGAAHYRKTAAELVRRYPAMMEPLRDGRLCITSVVELARVITPENATEVLPRFFHTSRQEAKAVSAELRPREAPALRMVATAAVQPVEPDRPPRFAPPSTSAATQAGTPATPTGQTLIASQVPAPTRSPSTTPTRPPTGFRETIDPITADLRRLHVTVSRRFLQKLDAARLLLSHSKPGADAEAVLEAGLDLLLERQAKRRGLVGKPRATKVVRADDRAEEDGANGSARDPNPLPGDVQLHAPAHVPAHVRREVWLRDDGRCQWPIDGGGSCGSTLRVELDHVVPRARGGASTPANLRVLCRIHNSVAARRAFGAPWMERFGGPRLETPS